MAKTRSSIIENSIYAALIGECETMENVGTYKGNGHHLAQRLTQQVSAGLLKGQQAKIYGVLTTTPQSTNDIAKATGLNTKIVSTQLRQINEKSLLIATTKTGRRRAWAKAH